MGNLKYSKPQKTFATRLGVRKFYRTYFFVLRQNEEENWYDRLGRIVSTSADGLARVGFKAKKWKRIKDMKAGTVQRTIQDDALPGGPRPKTLTYTAPFDRCDREQDYRTAWKNFEKRLGLSTPIGSKERGGTS